MFLKFYPKYMTDLIDLSNKRIKVEYDKRINGTNNIESYYDDVKKYILEHREQLVQVERFFQLGKFYSDTGYIMNGYHTISSLEKLDKEELEDVYFWGKIILYTQGGVLYTLDGLNMKYSYADILSTVYHVDDCCKECVKFVCNCQSYNMIDLTANMTK